MKKNSNIDAWVRRAFEKAGEEASAMEIVIKNIGEVLNRHHMDTLDAWAEISNTKIVAELVENAAGDDDFSETLDNLMMMGVISGYCGAIEDMKKGKLHFGS